MNLQRNFFLFFSCITLLIGCKKDDANLPAEVLNKDTLYLGATQNCDLKYLIYEDENNISRISFYCNASGQYDSVVFNSIYWGTKKYKEVYHYLYENNGRIIRRVQVYPANVIKFESVFYLNENKHVDSIITYHRWDGSIESFTSYNALEQYEDFGYLEFDSDSNILGGCNNGLQDPNSNPCSLNAAADCTIDLEYIEGVGIDYKYLVDIVPMGAQCFFMTTWSLGFRLNKPVKSYEWISWNCQLNEDHRLNFNFDYKIDRGRILQVVHKDTQQGFDRSIKFYYAN